MEALAGILETYTPEKQRLLMAKTLINLWSCPRNVSTAFMYSWAQRPDTQVWDEPLYAHYLRTSGAVHPVREAILETMEQDGSRVVQDLILQGGTAEVAFYKQMTHHLYDLDDSFIGQTRNILFIRDPDAILASYSKVIEEPVMQDIGVQAQYDLYQKWAPLGKIDAVLDSKYLLMNPEVVLQTLCDRLGIPFYAEMLRWEAGARPEDGVWAPHWYTNVHKSTGFLPYRPKEIALPERLLPLSREAKPLYEFLSAQSIR